MKLVAAGTFSLLGIIGLLVYFQFSKPGFAHAATSGDYQAITTGNWNSTGTWQKFNGTAWVAAGATPTSADGVIEIPSGVTVTLTADVTADQIIIDAGASLVINSSRYLYTANGTGTDLNVNGTLTINNGGYLSQNSSSSVAVNGTLICANNATHTINASSTITISSGGLYRDDGGSITTSSNHWTVSSGGIYQCNADNAALPHATWNTGSTCKITGVTNNVPSNLNQPFYNFTWDCLSQSSNCDFSNNLSTINGDFTIANTGSSSIKLRSGSSTSTVSGNFIQTGGTFYMSSSNSANSTLNVSGNFVQSGGSFYGGSGNNSVGTLNVSGNYILTGGTLTVGGNTQSSTEIVFGASGTQTYSASGITISGNVNYTVSSGTTLDLGTSTLTGTGNFTLSSGGGLMINSSSGITSSGATGTIQVTGTRSFSTGANYTYNGTSTQVTGNGLPSTVNNLTLNNSNGLTLTNTVAIAGALTLTSGIITTGANEVSVTSTSASSITGHSSTSYVVGNLRRAIALSGSYDFPIGTASNYELINATFTAQLGISNILATYTNTNPALSGWAGAISYSGKSFAGMLNNGYWTLTPDATLNAGVYAVTLYAKGYTNANGTDSSQFVVLKRHDNSSNWGLSGVPNIVGQLVSNSSIKTAVTGLTTFSHFGVGGTGGGGGSLPIKLIYFTAKYSGDHVNVDWATGAEINNDYFTVERSEDGINFERLFTRPGAGNSTVDLYYHAADDNPLQSGYSYYRLKQTDYDGHFSYSNIESVKRGMKESVASAIEFKSISPNPFSDNFRLNFVMKEEVVADLQIFNLSGQVVYATQVQTRDGFNQYQFHDDLNLAKGIYFVNLSYGDKKITQKIVKE